MQYRKAKYINDSGWIDCEIQHPVYGWGPYTLSPSDPDIIARKNNDDLLAAMAAKGDVSPYVPPTQAELDVMLAQKLRADRDIFLSAVDAVAGNVLRWGDLSVEAQADWAAYRRALLDVPQQDGFPNNVEWPAQPV